MQGDGEAYWYRLKPAGLQRAMELRRTRGPGNQAFIAMWFDKRMNLVFDRAFQPAFDDVGYTAYRVDRDPHDNRIDDKIIAEIRRSRILIADCTGGRQSVYFEAGLAYGLGLEVIWSCFDPTAAPDGTTPFDAPVPADGADPWFKQLSFDTRQYTCLAWATLADLKIKIVDRVRARGLDLKIKA